MISSHSNTMRDDMRPCFQMRHLSSSMREKGILFSSTPARLIFPPTGCPCASIVRGWTDILSSIPPILWSVMELARFRRLDAVSLLAVIGIFLSLAAMALGGNPRLLLARESLVTGIIGLLFLASLLLPRPLMFYLARSTMAKETAEASV